MILSKTVEASKSLKKHGFQATWRILAMILNVSIYIPITGLWYFLPEAKAGNVGEKKPSMVFR